MYRFNAIPIKVSASYFVYMDKSILKFTERNKIAQKSQHNMEGEAQRWRIDTTRHQDSLYSYSNQGSVVLKKD